MRVATLGGLSGAISQAVPLRSNGVGAFIEAVVPLSPPSFRGLGHVPGNTIGDALTYMNAIAARVNGHVRDPGRAAGLHKTIREVMVMYDLDEADPAGPMSSQLRKAIATLDNRAYFAAGQWYKVPWLWWAVGGTLLVGSLGAWWWLR